MSPRRVVLVEDNPGDVLLVQMALEENGLSCELVIFHDGQEALKALWSPEKTERNVLIPDAILLDLNTPKSDGFDVLARLKQVPCLAQVPVAIITSSQAASDRARAKRLGAIRYIQKPSQLDTFLTEVGRAVKEILEEGGPFEESVLAAGR